MVHSLIQPHLPKSIHTTSRLKAPPRVQQVCQCLLDGLSNKEIATRLQISRHTVHVYIKDLYKLRRVHSRAELLSGYLKEASPLIWQDAILPRCDAKIPGRNFQKPDQNIAAIPPVPIIHPIARNKRFGSAKPNGKPLDTLLQPDDFQTKEHLDHSLAADTENSISAVR